MLVRILIFVAIVAAIFIPLNVVAYRQLVRIHPRRRRIVLALVILGNLLWPFLPRLERLTWLSRFARSVFAPIWFGWTSFTLVYCALLLLILLAWLPMRKRMPFVPFARWPSRVFLWTVIIGFVVGCWQALVPLRVERVPIVIANLPPQLEGKRIALLADLHVGMFTRPSRLERIFKTTDALKPDVVLLAGDLIDDDPVFVPKLLAGTRALSPATPLYAVLGNHEMYGDPFDVIGRLRGSRIRLLVNEGVAEGPLWIAGVSDYAAGDVNKQDLKPSLGKALQGMPPGALAILFAHQPRAFEEARQRNLPLVLAAHTHGGQLGFRPLRWSLAGVFLRYHMGLYRAGASQLYINTGTGFWVLPFRLGMTSEITLIELRRAR